MGALLMRSYVSQRGSMRHKGRLTEWNDDRGFGFVTSLEDQSRAFVHVSAFPHEMRRPQALDLLSYDIRHDERGRLQAMNVEFLAAVARRGARSQPSASREIPVWIPSSLLAVVLVVGFVLRGGLVLGLAGGYALMSALTFAAYAADKSAAQRGRFRTQESALHLLEILGGWPGALVAQRALRHKTVKASFQVAFWTCVALNIAGLIAVVGLTPPG